MLATPTSNTELQDADLDLQLELFTKTDPDSSIRRYNNSIAFLDAAPRYLRGKTKLLPVSTTQSPVLRREFVFSGTKHFVEIKPVVVSRTVDGVTSNFFAYASDREESVERCLLKLASDGAINADQDSTGNKKFHVTFSRYQLFIELKNSGHSLSYREIDEAIEILTGSSCTITQESEQYKKVLSGPYFPERLTIEKKQGERADRTRLQLNTVHSAAIESGSYRQYLYSRVARHKKPLARWIDMYLSLNYDKAGLPNHENFKVRLSEILTGYGYERSSGQRNLVTERRDVRTALNDLTNAKDTEGNPTPVIRHVPKAIAVKDAYGDTIDYEYDLTPTAHFISEQKRTLGKAKGLRTLASRI